ncbi:MAG TPA: hypothetical protein VFH78_02880 [Candidatus Thermoplasmatota archaeon]|nr:hypothetical protein [Candidatus Thermoplasmatota archaeon]
MRLPLLLLLAALLAPPAWAQVGIVPAQLSVTANDPGGSGLVPGATTEVTVIVNYNVPPSGRPSPAPTLDRPEGTQPTRITLATKSVPSWVTNVSFTPPELFIYLDPQNVTTPSHRREVIAHVNVSADAPAQQREPFIVTATAEPNGNVAGASGESSELNLYARVVGVANVTGPESVRVGGGRWSTVEYAVRNDGNAPILMMLNVTVRPENSQVEFTDRVQLEAGESAVIPVRLRTPWTNAEFGSLELEATPIVDGEPGTPARAEVDVVGESAVPAVAPLALVALVVALARARRRG